MDVFHSSWTKLSAAYLFCLRKTRGKVIFLHIIYCYRDRFDKIKMVTYLEEDSVSGRNAVEHVTGDVLDIGAGRSIGHDVREIQHAALDARECIGDGLGGGAEPSGDVDQRVQPSEDVAALLDDDVHDEAAVGD